MGLLEFNKLPINTLVGADWKTFKAITAGREIDPAYRGKYRLTKAVCRLLSTLAPLQEKRYRKLLADKPLEHDPVFILGHWRSGTTFMHNVFSCDKHFGYNTTYQTVFPHLMMWGQPFFKKNMSWLMPDKRPTDNMELAVDLPQEEEFALANMMPYTYYNFWFLPKYQQEYADKYLLFNDISDEELKVFEDIFTKLIKISLWNTGGTQFLSKNPPHTGRVKELVKMFPNAKFIYLMRNPYTVFESTRNFFTNTIQPLKLEDISPETLEQNVLSIYAKLYHKYEADKRFIPEGNLMEVKFEDFEADAMAMTEYIYKSLSIPGFEAAAPAISQCSKHSMMCPDGKVIFLHKLTCCNSNLSSTRNHPWNYADSIRKYYRALCCHLPKLSCKDLILKRKDKCERNNVCCMCMIYYSVIWILKLLYLEIHKVARQLACRSSTIHKSPYDTVVFALFIKLYHTDGILRLYYHVSEVFSASCNKEILSGKIWHCCSDWLPLLWLKILFY